MAYQNYAGAWLQQSDANYDWLVNQWQPVSLGNGVDTVKIWQSFTLPTGANNLIVFGDGQYANGTNKYMRAPVKEFPVTIGDSVPVSVRAAGTQGFRHKSNTTNVCFADGHAESRRDRFPETTPPSGAVAPGTGFLSADNRAYDGRP